MVLLIKRCDLVLGVQWLLSLGPIVWNFASLTMQFEHLQQTCTLQGIVPGALHMYSGAQLSKCIALSGQGPSPMLLTSTVQANLTLPNETLPHDLE